MGHCDCRMKNCCPPGLMALVMVTEKLFVPRAVTELVRSGVHWLKGRAMSALPSKWKFPPNPHVALICRLVWDERALLNTGCGEGKICSGVLVPEGELVSINPSPSWPHSLLPIAQRLPSD